MAGCEFRAIVWGPQAVAKGVECRNIASTLDLLPTLGKLAGAELPGDRVIDGADISHLFRGDFEKADPDKVFFYYFRVELQALRQGKWKLHLMGEQPDGGIGPYRNGRHIPPADRVKFDAPLLVDLESDISETTDVSKENPAVVKRLLALAEAMREDLGDYDRVGENMRFFEADLTRPTKPVPE